METTLEHGLRVRRRESLQSIPDTGLKERAKILADELQTNRPEAAALIDVLVLRMRKGQQ